MPLLNVVMLTKKQVVKLVLCEITFDWFWHRKVATGELTMQINNGKDGELFDFTDE
jgi:hypothetical protein